VRRVRVLIEGEAGLVVGRKHSGDAVHTPYASKSRTFWPLVLILNDRYGGEAADGRQLFPPRPIDYTLGVYLRCAEVDPDKDDLGQV
jgi:hypothetical protein